MGSQQKMREIKKAKVLHMTIIEMIVFDNADYFATLSQLLPASPSPVN